MLEILVKLILRFIKNLQMITIIPLFKKLLLKLNNKNQVSGCHSAVR